MNHPYNIFRTHHTSASPIPPYPHTPIPPFLFLFLFSACASEPAPISDEIWFQEVSQSVGLDFVHSRADQIQFNFPEIMSGGAGWIDYDEDGWLDLYLVQGGAIDNAEGNPFRNKLYRNVDGTRFEDVSAAAGVDDGHYGMGLAIGDYDNDGDDDLYVTNVGPNVLYRNEGNGRFTDVSEEAGVNHNGWGASAAFSDYNNDGWLDLYVVNYIEWSLEQELECTSGGAGRDYCHPDNYRAPAADVLFLNEKNGRFRNVALDSGIGAVKANGLGIVPADFDEDGYVDFYVANDGDPNQLWMNDGDGTFSDRALLSGSALNRQGMAEAGMGVVAFDVENDGDTDLFMTHLRDESNTFYRNDGGAFQDVTGITGLASTSIPYTGFGIGAGDFDHDGHIDLYVANGRVGRAGASDASDPFAEPNQLFKGMGDGTFEEVGPAGGAAANLVGTSRAVASADYDNDGDLDIAILNSGSRIHLLRNEAPKKGSWIGFSILDETGRDAIGARISISSNGKTWHKIVQPAGSYQASNDPRIHVGLGDAVQVDSVIVSRATDSRLHHGPLETGIYHELYVTGQP